MQAGEVHGDIHVHSTTAGNLPIPRQLTAPPPRLAGRQDELDRLNRILDGRSGDQPLLIALTGPGGVGKTALALRWLHDVVHHFPHGHLQVDLAGFSGTTPLDPSDVLGMFLRALDIPPERVPARTDEQAALFRSLTAQRALIILLDNAQSAEHIQPLLAGASNSVVVTTSRNRMWPLTEHGAHLLPIEPLTSESALAMLSNTIGPDRVERDRGQANVLVTLCGRMPIALRLAASRLAVHPQWPVKRIVAELTAESVGVERSMSTVDRLINACLDLSYRTLSPEAATLYRRLGLHPGHDFGTGVASTVVHKPGLCSLQLLEILTEASLLEEHAEDRYRFHDLLRQHAHRHAVEDEDGDTRHRVVVTILEWYLAAASAADHVITPYRRRLPYTMQSSPTETPAFTERSDALQWLDHERTNLIAAARMAMEVELPELAWHLSDVMWPLLLYRKHYSDRLEIDRRGVEAAQAWGNQFAAADMLKRLGRICTTLGQYQEADQHFAESLKHWTDLNDQRGQADTRELCALLRWQQGDIATAIAEFEQLSRLNINLGADRSAALNLINLTELLLQSRRAADALPRALQARQILADFRDSDPYNWSRSGIVLGTVHMELGDRGTAIPLALSGLADMELLGSVHGQAEAHLLLADLARQADNHSDAQRHLAIAHEKLVSVGSPRADRVRRKLDTEQPS
jgi:tetratricopeptide (TPR) repeat protein